MQVLCELPKVIGVRRRSESCPNHTYIDPNYVLTYVERGNLSYRIENRIYKISSGVLCLKPPYNLHIVKPENSSFRKTSVSFSIQGMLRISSNSPLAVCLNEDYQKLSESLIENLVNIWTEQNSVTDTIAAGIVTQLIGLFFANVAKEAYFLHDKTRYWKPIEKAVCFMRENLERNISLHEISNQVGLSSSYFSKLFKSYIGIPIHKYLTIIRLEKAKRLLWLQKLSITDIAQESGFNDVHHLNKVFRKYQRCSPSEWRNKL